jgi:hypothetical protein
MKRIEKKYENETQQDIYEQGFNRGWNTASWVDIPEFGTKVPKDVDYIGVGEICEANVADAMEMIASEAESNSRQFSPFEDTCSELNAMEQDEEIDFEPWDAYEDGIADGIRANVASRIKAA